MCDVNESKEQLHEAAKIDWTGVSEVFQEESVVFTADLLALIEAYERQARAVTAADALRDWLLTKHVEDGQCPVCSHTAKDLLDHFFHADTCLIAAYDLTRPHKPPQEPTGDTNA